MKKLFIITALILLAGVAYGQTLEKGAMLSAHMLVINLKPDVTLDQYLDFVEKTWIPEWEKQFPGLELFLMKGLNRETESTYSLLFYYASKEVFNKYWNDDGSATDLGNAGVTNLEPVYLEGDKFTPYNPEISDWIIK
jgi:hypothetical protein